MQQQLSDMDMESMDAVALGAANQYDVVTAVMIKHVPVTVGIVGVVLALLAPFAYELWRRRRPASGEPVEYIDIRNAFKRRRSDEELEEIAEGRVHLDRLADGIGSLTPEEMTAHVEKITHPLVRTEALVLVGDRLHALGDGAGAAAAFSEGLSLASRRPRKEHLGRCALGLADLAADRGDRKGELAYARKGLVLFDQAGLAAQAERLTARIRELKGGASVPGTQEGKPA